jgi:hypothetical protein
LPASPVAFVAAVSATRAAAPAAHPDGGNELYDGGASIADDIVRRTPG